VDKVKEGMQKNSGGCQTFDQDLLRLYSDGKISAEEALTNSDHRNDVRLSLLNVTPVASAKPLQPGEAVAAADPASPPVEQWMLEELGKKEPGFNGAEKRH
jgi:twitching motility protein PilU